MTVESLAQEQDATDARRLRLPDFTIKGFRGIDELEIPRLGRVTLLVGKNGVGKTTVLDAVRVYIYRARYEALHVLLSACDEVYATVDEDGNTLLEPDWSALFHGRDVPPDGGIAIASGGETLRIEKSALSVDDVSRIGGLGFTFIADERLSVLSVQFRGQQQVLPCFLEPDSSDIDLARDRIRRSMRHPLMRGDPSPELNCESLGPWPLTSEALGQYWDRVALTNDEDLAVRALRLVLAGDVDGISMVGDERGRREWRRAIVKLASHERPVPLKSLGEGALRLFCVALALANSRDGFLLIDEAENGIHHTVQRDFWRMVLQTARDNNVQVLATTHGWDCVRGFAQAATELAAVEGVLVRLERRTDRVRAIEYTEDELAVAARDGIDRKSVV